MSGMLPGSCASGALGRGRDLDLPLGALGVRWFAAVRVMTVASATASVQQAVLRSEVRTMATKSGVGMVYEAVRFLRRSSCLVHLRPTSPQNMKQPASGWVPHKALIRGASG